MEQSFILKHHGRMSLFEQNNMTSEERIWWIRRLEKQSDDEKAAVDNGSHNSGKLPPMSANPKE